MKEIILCGYKFSVISLGASFARSKIAITTTIIALLSVRFIHLTETYTHVHTYTYANTFAQIPTPHLQAHKLDS